MSKVKLSEDSLEVFWYCPGCECNHVVPVMEGRWTFNGSLENPSLYPSVRITTTVNGIDSQCHVVMTDGKLNFCSDCTHKFNGQIVEMEEME